eukprot:109013-Rhodomonas_salina.1
MDTCCCSRSSRANSEGVTLGLDVGGRAEVAVPTPGHGVITLRFQEEASAPFQSFVVLSPLVTRVLRIESWVEDAEPARPHAHFRPPAIENICGKLPSQDLWHLVQSGAARRINKCFGRRFCMYSLAGNVSFDSGLCMPQYRGVRKLAPFLSSAQRFGLDVEGLKVHLVVLSGNVGNRVTVGDQGTMSRLLPRRGPYKACSGLDIDSSNLRFQGTNTEGDDATSIAITRRGCVVIRMCFRPPRELTDSVIAEVQQQANCIMQDVVSLS